VPEALKLLEGVSLLVELELAQKESVPVGL
jgi:hypothetical protein